MAEAEQTEPQSPQGWQSDKLRQGLSVLESAGDNPILLGNALLNLHGALEDYLRDWIARHPYLPFEVRNGDRHGVTWPVIRKCVTNYSSLPDDLYELPEWAYRFSKQRNDVAHGGPFIGERSELEQYAQIIALALRTEIPQTECRGQPVTLSARALGATTRAPVISRPHRTGPRRSGSGVGNVFLFVLTAGLLFVVWHFIDLGPKRRLDTPVLASVSRPEPEPSSLVSEAPTATVKPKRKSGLPSTRPPKPSATASTTTESTAEPLPDLDLLKPPSTAPTTKSTSQPVDLTAADLDALRGVRRTEPSDSKRQ